MRTRVLSGLIMLPLLFIVYLGGPVLQIVCLAIGMIGVKEFYDGFSTLQIKPSYPIACGSALALYAVHYFAAAPAGEGFLWRPAWLVAPAQPVWYLLWFFGVMIASLLYLFKIDQRKPEDAMATATGIFYVVFFSFHVVLTDQTGAYSILIWLIFLTAFGTDIMAYFTGYIFGKHKLCPKISPKKTVEGAVGGVLGSLLLCGLFGCFFAEALVVHCMIIGALGGAVSQLGDLTASVFKRKMGIKDYGGLIPGHGGILDRFDSVLFTAPLVYYYIALVLGAP